MSKSDLSTALNKIPNENFPVEKPNYSVGGKFDLGKNLNLVILLLIDITAKLLI